MNEQNTPHPTPTPTHTQPSRFKTGLSGFIFIHVIAALSPPLNASHATFVLGCATLPLSLWICYKIHPHALPKLAELMRTYIYSKVPQLEASLTPVLQQYRSRFMLVYYICLFSIVSATVIEFCVLINRHADTSPATRMNYAIVGTYTEKASDNIHSNALLYFAAISNPYHPAWIPAWSTDTLGIRITKDDYERITAHPHNISITLHRGRFGFPWTSNSDYMLEAIPDNIPLTQTK